MVRLTLGPEKPGDERSRCTGLMVMTVTRTAALKSVQRLFCRAGCQTWGMVSTIVHLVRHGEVDNPAHVLYGVAPGFHLSDRGRAMARTAADHLGGLSGRVRANIVHLGASPLERAQETAAPIAAEFGLPTATDARLIEAGNTFQGERVTIPFLLKPRNLVRLRAPGVPSWGEPYVEIAERMAGAIEDARVAALGHEAVLVSHQLPIWVARVRLEGRRSYAHDPRRRRCALGSITSLHFVDNDVAYVAYVEPSPGDSVQRFTEAL
jgi:broad specificity phosphatase PhoE